MYRLTNSVCLFVPNANPLHYYAFRVPRKADRWRWVWSIFEPRTAWSDNITCGMSICIVYSRKFRLGWLCVTVGWWWWKEGRRWNSVPAHSLLFSKITKGATRLNVPIRRTNRYQQYYMPSQHIYCGRVWNLIQACDYSLVTRKCTSPPLLALRLKIFKWKFTTMLGI